MKSYAFSLWLALTFLAACFFSVSCPAFGQSLTTGGVTGTVTDPSGAAVANATVTLKNNDTGAAVSGVSNSTGAYRFALLNPPATRSPSKLQAFREFIRMCPLP
jgi:carboxypeptidase family protein